MSFSYLKYEKKTFLETEMRFNLFLFGGQDFCHGRSCSVSSMA